MSIASSIKRLRKTFHYTQEQLADLCDVSRQAVAKWEGGTNTPDIEKLVLLSDIFHVSLDELVTEKKSRKVSKSGTLSQKSYVENERIVNEALKSAMAHRLPEDSINSFIAYIGSQIGCDRVYIFEPSGEAYYQNTYEWCARGVSPQKEYLQSIPREEFNVWLTIFSSGDYIFIEDLEAIADSDPVVYRWLKPQGIQSLLAFPLFGGRSVLGVDNPAPAFVRQTLSLIEIMVHFVEVLLNQRDLYQELNISILQNKHISAFNNGVQYRLNLTTGEFHADQAQLAAAGYELPFHTFEDFKATMARHPEFYDLLMTDGIQYALDNKQNVCVEFLSYRQSGKIRWNKLSITPFMGASGKVLQLYGILQDCSDSHPIIARYNRYAASLSGGLHICYLSNPIHLHYASDDLCAFLGYTREELEQHTQGLYTSLIVEEDRSIFRSYLRALAITPNMNSCEYRMIRKDGSIVTVVDTMESIESSNGKMYGYAYILEKSKMQALLDMACDREQQQLQVITKQYDVLNALGKEYREVFRVWLDEDKAQAITLCSAPSACIDHDGAEFIPYYYYCKRYVHSRVHPDDRARMLTAMHPDTVRAALAQSEEYSVMYRALYGEKASFYQMKYISIPNQPEEKGLRCVAVFKNVDQVIQEREAMKYAYIDAMTGVLNRNAFERDFKKLDEYPQTGFIFCDVNRLKETNDLQGHSQGDALLIHFADFLKQYFSHDCIYRIGGDEFICMIGKIGKETFEARAKHLQEKIRENGNIAAIGFAHGSP